MSWNYMKGQMNCHRLLSKSAQQTLKHFVDEKVICWSRMVVCFRCLWGFRQLLAQTSNSGSDCDGSRCAQRVGSSSNDLTASLAFPDSNAGALDIVLSAENASVCAVLGYFNLSDQLSQSGTVSCSVLSGDTDLLSALTHCELIENVLLKMNYKVLL